MSEVTVSPDPGSPTGGIQEAIDDLLTVGNGGTVKVPPAQYNITQPIVVGKPGEFTEVWLRGLGAEGPWELSGPRIYPQFSDRWCIGVQGGRATKISGIWMQGPNSPPAGLPVVEEELWDGLGSINTHSPFVGIAIDPLSGTQPTTNPYTPPTGWTFGERHSSAVHIDRCGIHRFISGVAVKPSGGSGADQNGDFIRITDSNIKQCKWGVTANGSQTRLTRVIGSTVNECWTCLGARVFGPQKGADIFAKDCAFDYSGRILWHSLVNGTTCTIEDCYGEAMGAILDAGGSRSVHGIISMRGGRFGFQGIWHGHSDPGLTWPYHFRLQGCTLSVHGTMFSMDWHPSEIRRHITFWMDRHEPISQSWLDLVGMGIIAYSPDSEDPNGTDRTPYRDVGYLQIVRQPEGSEQPPYVDVRDDQAILNCRACDAAKTPQKIMAWPIPNQAPLASNYLKIDSA